MDIHQIQDLTAGWAEPIWLNQVVIQNERNGTAAATPQFETVDLLRGLSILAVVLLQCSIGFGGYGVHRADAVLAPSDLSEWR